MTVSTATKPAPIATRATWKASISFGLVNVPVACYSATQENDVSFKQIHCHPDGEPGFVKQRRYCSVCSEEVANADIEKGFDTGNGIITLTKADIDGLPLDTTKAIAVQEFVELSDVDPILFEKTYYLAPQEAAARKAYVLLRDGLAHTGRAGVVKVTMRNREQVALLHVRDNGFGTPVLTMTTLRWADEVRQAAMPSLKDLPTSSEAELAMAKMLIDSLTSETFNAGAYTDGYREALETVIASKRAGLEPLPAPVVTEAVVLDLMAALTASVERNRSKAVAA